MEDRSAHLYHRRWTISFGFGRDAGSAQSGCVYCVRVFLTACRVGLARACGLIASHQFRPASPRLAWGTGELAAIEIPHFGFLWPLDPTIWAPYYYPQIPA